MPDYTPSILNLGLHLSVNGIVEYPGSAAFCNEMQGELLAASFSTGDWIQRTTLSADGLSVVESSTLATPFRLQDAARC